MLAMKVLFYLPQNKKSGNKFEKEVVAAVPENRRECHYTIETFSARLRQLDGFLTLAVVFALRKKDLSDILSIKQILCGIRLILILPDNDKSTIVTGHKFYPRFLEFITGDYSRVIAVMKKIIDER